MNSHDRAARRAGEVAKMHETGNFDDCFGFGDEVDGVIFEVGDEICHDEMGKIFIKKESKLVNLADYRIKGKV